MSTEPATFQFTQEVLNSLEKGEKPSGLFVNFSYAFDSVGHKMLLLKLDRCGIRGIALKLLQSYLMNRKNR